MGVIKVDEIRGVRVQEKIFCYDCAEIEGDGSIKETDFILENEIENTEGFYFCDECGELL